MKKKFIIGALVLLVLFVLYTITFNMKPGTVYATDKIEYSKDGFVDSMELSNEAKLVASNDNYELYIDETTSHFKVVDLVNGVTWNSNPETEDPWESDPEKSITPTALDKQKSTLELSYFNDKGSLATINNYTLSIYHPESVLHDEGVRTYQIKYNENGFQVLYEIQNVDVDYLYFPKYLSEEVLATIPNREIIETLAYTGFDEELDMYEIKGYEDLSKLVLTVLYDVFYGENGLNYTREQSIAENAENGYTEKFEQVSFEVAVDVTLTEEGIKTSVIKDSIVENENAKLATISLYPYFGTAVSEIDDVETSGYLVVPDGSGAVIEFNNGKSYQQPYAKRLYGDDLGILPHKMPETQQEIKIPLYGMVKEDSGFAAIITAGDTMATLNADVSGRIDSYNKIYPSFNFREKESITLGSGYSTYGITLWTDEIIDTDFTVQYKFLGDTEASYVGIANVYKTYLENNFGFDSVDETSETILTTELLGVYDRQDFVLGIPYNTRDSLTTFEESQTILDALNDVGVSNVNVVYKGVMNGGLSSSINNQFDLENDLGSKRDYNDFLEYAEENNIEIFPETTIISAEEYNKMFDQYRYTANRVDGKQSYLFNYHLAVKLPNSETPFSEYSDDFVINPLYYEEIVNDFMSDYDGNSIAFEYLGGKLGGSYGDDFIYKQDALLIQQEIFKNLDRSVLTNSPYGFAIPYSDYITDVPFETTRYAILDYQIPLLQLIISGKVDYSTISLNTDYERSVDYNFLKAIETGSNLKYTLSFDSSQELKETEYNYYISTQYTNWLTRIEEQVKELDEIGVHSGYLVSHELIDNDVVKVTYSHGLEIIINYNLSDVTINGEVIEATSYLVLEVD